MEQTLQTRQSRRFRTFKARRDSIIRKAESQLDYVDLSEEQIGLLAAEEAMRDYSNGLYRFGAWR